MDAAAWLLITGFRHVLNEPDAEAGYARLAALTGGLVDDVSFRDAVSVCLRRGLIHDPIRLGQGALHCHWHLQLTPDGVAAARALLATPSES